MSDIVFGAEIELQDHASPVTEDTSIGLYNRKTTLYGNISSGSMVATVANGSIFDDDLIITLGDSEISESNIVLSRVGNELNLATAVSTTYVATNGGFCYANSRLKYIQNVKAGVSGYTSTMLIERGIEKWTKEIDLELGGNIEIPGSSGITLQNAGKFYNELKSRDIFLNGLTARTLVFNGTVARTKWTGVCDKPTWDSKKYKIPFRGSVDKRLSNIAKQISAVDYPNADASLLSKDIPVSFGRFNASLDADGNIIYENYAAFQRAGNKIDRFIAAATIDLGDGIEFKNLDENEHFIFPVVVVTSGLVYGIKLANAAEWYLNGVLQTAGVLTLDYFAEKFVHVIEGTGADKLRQIESAEVDLDTYPDGTIITVTVAAYFENTLAGNITASAASNSWLYIEGIEQDYDSDYWKCKAFLDENDLSVTKGLNLFIYESEKKVTVSGDSETVPIEENDIGYLRIPQFAYKDSGGADKNRIDIDSKLFNKTLDNIDSYIIKTIESFKTYGGADLSNFDTGATITDKIASGLFKFTNNPTLDYSGYSIVESASPENVTDKDSTTYSRYAIACSGGGSPLPIMNVYEFELPNVNDINTFQTLYLMAKITITTDIDARITESYLKNFRFFGAVRTAKTFSFNSTALVLGYSIDNAPDFYFEDSPDTKNLSFYVSANNATKHTGYINFEMSINDINDFKSVEKMYLMLSLDWIDDPPGNITIDIYEIAMMFAKTSNIKETIYSSFDGRIFNDTWGTRKTAADLMQSPADVSEHVDRLKNWSENNLMPSGGWGKAYADNPKISTAPMVLLAANANAAQKDITVAAGYGSRFRSGQNIVINDTSDSEEVTIDSIVDDVLTAAANLVNSYTTARSAVVYDRNSYDNTFDPNLNAVKDFDVSNQLLNYNDAYSDKIQLSLCREFHLIKFVNREGYECLKRIKKTDDVADINDTITLADVYDRTQINIKEPNPDNIYAEPFVRYNYESGGDSFQGIIRVTNVDADSPTGAEKQSYVEGVTGTEAENLWDNCHINWLKTRQTNKPPAELTDLKWANGADGYDIAIEYLDTWIRWMSNPVITLNVHYNKKTSGGLVVNEWELGHKFILTLPHQTNNVNIQCVVSRITVDPNPPYIVEIKAIMYSEDIAADFSFRDSMANFYGDYDWVDGMAALGNDNDKIDNT